MRVTRNSRSRAKMSASCSASSFADTLHTTSWACATVTALSGRLGTTLKFALVAPIPSNRVRVSTTVNPGDRRSSRTAWRRSWARLRICVVGRGKDCPGWWWACLHYGFITPSRSGTTIWYTRGARVKLERQLPRPLRSRLPSERERAATAYSSELAASAKMALSDLERLASQSLR
jgi:hypothetical protein